MEYGTLVYLHTVALAESPRNDAKIRDLSERIYGIELAYYSGVNA